MRVALRTLIVFGLVLVAISSGAAEQPLPPGIRIPVTLTKSINAKLGVGTPVECEVTSVVKLPDSLGMIPKGSKIVGQISLAKPRDKKESRLSIVLERIELPGRPTPLRAFIVGKLRARNSALAAGSGAVYSVQILPREEALRSSTLTANDQVPFDNSFKVVQSENPKIGSEVVSTEREVNMDIGSTFDVLTVQP